jgi:hypothetical protein
MRRGGLGDQGRQNIELFRPGWVTLDRIVHGNTLSKLMESLLATDNAWAKPCAVNEDHGAFLSRGREFF